MPISFATAPRRQRQLIRIAVAALSAALTLAASAQADGALAAVGALAVSPHPSTGPARIAAANAPGGALMNNLHERMQQIQATQEPSLRQRRMDEFLKALQTGMSTIAKPGAAPSK